MPESSVTMDTAYSEQFFFIVLSRIRIISMVRISHYLNSFQGGNRVTLNSDYRVLHNLVVKRSGSLIAGCSVLWLKRGLCCRYVMVSSGSQSPQPHPPHSSDCDKV